MKSVKKGVADASNDKDGTDKVLQMTETLFLRPQSAFAEFVMSATRRNDVRKELHLWLA